MVALAHLPGAVTRKALRPAAVPLPRPSVADETCESTGSTALSNTETPRDRETDGSAGRRREWTEISREDEKAMAQRAVKQRTIIGHFNYHLKLVDQTHFCHISLCIAYIVNYELLIR